MKESYEVCYVNGYEDSGHKDVNFPKSHYSVNELTQTL